MSLIAFNKSVQCFFEVSRATLEPVDVVFSEFEFCGCVGCCQEGLANRIMRANGRNDAEVHKHVWKLWGLLPVDS